MEKYSSGLVSESFWFVEFRKIIKLLILGHNWEEIKTMCLDENLLSTSKEYRTKRMYGYLKNRISVLDNDLLAVFQSSDLSTQKIINLIAIAKQNRLFYEFLYEVYREKATLGVLELADSDINVFFKKKQEQDDDIATWTDATLKRLRSSYFNFLSDAGLITLIDKKKTITPPILDITLERVLKSNGDLQMVKAVTGCYNV
ncbi:MAG: DUF1819 family protein [Oscillospiraceae bacterium]